MDLLLGRLDIWVLLLSLVCAGLLFWSVYLMTELKRNKVEPINEAAKNFKQDIKIFQASLDELLADFEQRSRRAIDLDQAMASSLTNSQDAEARIIELSNSRKEIGELLSIIADIGVQTRVLALNASIEAERAGAAGKGFAVVASEVNELSQESKYSLELIEDRLASLQAGIGRALTSISKANFSLKNFELDSHYLDFELKIESIRQQLNKLDNFLSQEMAPMSDSDSSTLSLINGFNI